MYPTPGGRKASVENFVKFGAPERVITARYGVCPGGENYIARRGRDAVAESRIFAVYYTKVDIVFFLHLRHCPHQKIASDLRHNIADKQYAHRICPRFCFSVCRAAVFAVMTENRIYVDFTTSSSVFQPAERRKSKGV